MPCVCRGRPTPGTPERRRTVACGSREVSGDLVPLPDASSRERRSPTRERSSPDPGSDPMILWGCATYTCLRYPYPLVGRQPLVLGEKVRLPGGVAHLAYWRECSLSPSFTVFCCWELISFSARDIHGGELGSGLWGCPMDVGRRPAPSSPSVAFIFLSSQFSGFINQERCLDNALPEWAGWAGFPASLRRSGTQGASAPSPFSSLLLRVRFGRSKDAIQATPSSAPSYSPFLPLAVAHSPL